MTLLQQFEHWAEHRPDSPCVGSLTYGQLNAQANGVAQRLLRAGRCPLIGLQCPHGLPAITGMLAILKMGAAYLPLDPRAPAERVRRLLQQAGVTRVLTLADLEGQPAGNNPQIEPGRLMYVMYTSGSSGEPRGVLVTRANVDRLFPASSEWVSLAATQVWSHLHSLSFGFSVWEVWGALAHGGRLVVVPHGRAFVPEDCLELWSEEQVSVASLTPTAFRILATALTDSSPPLTSLQTIVLSGEPVDSLPLSLWLDRYPEISLLNMYAATETAGEVACHQLTRDDVGRPCSRLGRPLADVDLRLVDDSLQEVAVGEILVRGPMVAEGYLNRPELTAERFLLVEGVPAYRTGDLGRRLEDGTIEFLGRRDRQFKLGGRRVEPAEIERELQSLTGVSDAVVWARDQLLWACVVSEEPPEQLRAELSIQLPSPLVPARIVVVSKLPLTANGKLDLLALEALAAPAPRSEHSAYRSPAPGTERLLAEIWEAVLGLREVGADDDFFDLGGHSLVATQVLSRLREAFGVELSLRSFFEAATVSRCARLIDALVWSQNLAALPAPGNGREELAL